MPRDPDALFRAAKKRDVPFDFVLDELAELDPTTRPMFGATGVYVGEKMFVMLRDKGKDDDDGVWVATSDVAHIPALRALMPSLRDIDVLGGKIAKWQVLRKDADDFEESVLKLCKLIRQGDPRIGTVPVSVQKRAARAAKADAKPTKSKPKKPAPKKAAVKKPSRKR